MIVIRAVLDTNVLVSYLLTHRPPIATLIDRHLADGHFVMVTAHELLDEIGRVLQYPRLQRYYPDADRVRFVALLAALGETVELPDAIPPICRDPDDDRIIACGVAGEATFIVSGDGDLLALGRVGAMRIVSAAQFAGLLDQVCGDTRTGAHTPEIKAVIFDFGRVISAQKPMSLFRDYEAELGLAPGVLNATMFGTAIWEQVLVGRRTVDESWEEISPRLGLHTPQAVAEFRRRYAGDEAINEGVLHLIRALRGRYKLAVLSNAPPGLARWLTDWEIDGLFDVIFCSGDEGVAKPDAAAFQRTLRRLGVAPEEAVFIDDSPRHVAAARALGLHGVHFTTAEALKEELAGLLAES